MSARRGKEPAQAWVTTFAGTAINLCLGILYAWSIWKSALVDGDLQGTMMTGINQGWRYLNNSQASIPFSLCVIIFALLMIPGGRLQDRFSPRVSAALGGLFLGAGCLLAGLLKSYTGLILGFGVLGGIGMGIGYAAPTPAALKWFSPQKRGLIAGLVVSGYGGAALYIGPLGEFLINRFGISGSFYTLGIGFTVIILLAAQLLKAPPEGYEAPVPAGADLRVDKSAAGSASLEKHDWKPREIVRCRQFYALVFMFIITTQSGLLIIANSKGLLVKAAGSIPFFMKNAWILVSYGGLVNAVGRIGTGVYSDRIGRNNAFALNCGVTALCLFALPWVIRTENVVLLFLVVGIAYWHYGGGLALMPSFVADYFGSRNLGVNYGLVFIGWGLGFFMARLGGILEDLTGSLSAAFVLSGALLLAGVVLARLIKKPTRTAAAVQEVTV